MARCSVCTEKIVAQIYQEQDASEQALLRTWSSYTELVSLARSGCDLCTLLLQYFVSADSKETLTRSTDTVYLYKIHSIYLHLQCGGLHLSITLERDPHKFNASLADGYNPLSRSIALLQDCLSLHKLCYEFSIEKQADPRLTLPRRLLRLSQGSTISVIDVNEWISRGLATPDELSQYCTLSYRWGPDTHDCILKAPFSGQIDLTFDQMPQTFKDAITTTRALGVRFLWIDALCIVQSSAYGDDADWNAEGSRMGIIYQGAICTIAATCARSADDGFLSKTGCKFIAAENCRIQPQPTEQSQYTFLQPCPPDVYRWVTSSNLNRRGWVQQERALSRRVLHFTEQGIFWECQETTAHCSYGEVSTDSTQFIRCPQRYASILTGSWFDFVSEYSRSQFSKVEDRLIALSSVAKTLQPIFANYEYCAGLWSGSLARGLSWHRASSVTPSIGARASIAPSWSWASVTGYVSFLSTTYCEDLITVLEINMIPVLDYNPYGNIREGRLKLRGQLVRRLLATTNEGNFFRRDEDSIYWDELQDTSISERTYTILPVKAAGYLRGPVLYCAIILELVPTHPNVVGTDIGLYRRIGYVEYQQTVDHFKKWCSKRRKHQRKVERDMSTINLV